MQRNQHGGAAARARENDRIIGGIGKSISEKRQIASRHQGAHQYRAAAAAKNHRQNNQAKIARIAGEEEIIGASCGARGMAHINEANRRNSARASAARETRRIIGAYGAAWQHREMYGVCVAGGWHA